MTKAKPRSSIIRGLYAITPDLADTARLCEMVEASILGGANVIQYRNKLADSNLRVKQSRALLDICRQHGVPLIINDHVKLCLALDADGVHIGADDGDVATTKARIGNKILGVSCYNRLDLAQAAQAAGADYVAFGACFSSGTKPNAVKADLNLFQADLDIPKVAIGGIMLDNIAAVVDAGAEAVAVIGALFHHQNIQQTAENFSSFFKVHSS
jgi:thiamine-phosphate pyrophosphorylase